MKCLFVYPNSEGYPIIPLGISVLSGILKHYGHETDLFDMTFIISKRADNEARETSGVVKKVNVDDYWGKGDNIDPDQAFRDKIRSFNPDLIAFSVVESNYVCAKNLMDIAKEFDIPTVAGNIFPTINPDLFKNDVDFVCVGEGEYAIKQLLEEGKMDVITKYYDWEPNIYQDWSIFDLRHLMKPFTGKMYKTGYFEMSRGCPNHCSYCINHLNQEIYSGMGLHSYNRRKSLIYAIKEMKYLKDKHSLELIFFNDENFLQGIDMTMFRDKYKDVGLPFFIMTRADTLLKEESVRMLKDAGCATIGIGVECGNEKFRREILNKGIPNRIYKQAFDNCHKYDIRTTANVMIGLPFETEELIRESADFCRELKARSISLSIFTPFQGTKLRQVCIDNGFMEDKIYDDISIRKDSVLDMSQLSKERIRELYDEFNGMVYR